VEHIFSHRRLRLHVFRAEAPAGRVRRRGFDAHRWLPPAELPALPQSALMKKALAMIGAPVVADPARARTRSARA
jgi:adenine-specific DNA glycosylase